mgnify:CR=1 FL=1
MGVLIGENDMYTDFGMILTDLSLEMPEFKTKYQELPLENGSIDLSEVVTGRPVYGLRTLKLTFKRRGGIGVAFGVLADRVCDAWQAPADYADR